MKDYKFFTSDSYAILIKTKEGNAFLHEKEITWLDVTPSYQIKEGIKGACIFTKQNAELTIKEYEIGAQAEIVHIDKLLYYTDKEAYINHLEQIIKNIQGKQYGTIINFF